MTGREGKGEFQNWQELRDRAIELFNGEAPHPVVEQTLIDAYEVHPDAVERELSKVAADLAAGTIRSGWGIYAKRAERILHPPSNPDRPSSLDREKRIARAEQWIRATGCHFDRETEVLLELFSGTGLLSGYAQVELIEDTTDSDAKWTISEPAGDTGLVDRILKLYNEFRPKGITIEEDAQARADKYRAQQSELRAALAQARAELDQKQTHRKPLPDADYSATEEPIPF